MGFLAIVLLAASCSTNVLALRARKTNEGTWRSRLPPLEEYTFDRFVKDFSRDYQEGSSDYAVRAELFEKRKQEMISLNAHPGLPWKAGVSKFMDWTEEERKKVYGYKGRGSKKSAPAGGVTSLARSNLPSTFSVSTKFGNRTTQLLSIVRDQGNCGSCWAEAATATLEGQLEVNEPLMKELEALRSSDTSVPPTPTLSSQTIVSCTKNPHNCGGQGGCEGATVELAYGMLQGTGGLPFATEWNYKSGKTGVASPCADEVFSHHRIGITGFTVLPMNKLLPLQEALVSSGGPIAVSVDASNWFAYSEGVFIDRWPAWKGDFQVNHAVTLMGYKKPSKDALGWWTIKNSWGNYWGEDGYIRIELKEDEEEHCGWDTNTHEGLACDGDPDTAWVCGTCGILYDSAYPTGLHLTKGKANGPKSKSSGTANVETALETVQSSTSEAEAGNSQVDLTSVRARRQ